jgi:D-arginine dehydrogenase
MTDVLAQCEFLVVGAGIAGASAAAALAPLGPVVVIEREGQPGYHSTGRSAALFTETYGPPAIRALSAASRVFLTSPPSGFADTPLLHRRGLLVFGAPGREAALETAMEDGSRHAAGVRTLSPDEAVRVVPVLRREAVCGAVLEPEAMDIDVHALHQGYLRLTSARGGTVRTDAGLTGLEQTGNGWRAQTTAGTVLARIVVNAAGAWADEVAALAGARPIGLEPRRRTAFVFDPEVPVPCDDWPMTGDLDETMYFKPEGGRLLASPADATPMPACDVQAEELDVAEAVDRLQRATTLQVRRIVRRWAGLRTFLADGLPIVGWDEDRPDGVPGFFWLAGHGGYGISTAPAMARLAGAVAAGTGLPADLGAAGVSEAALSPARLSAAAAVD